MGDSLESGPVGSKRLSPVSPPFGLGSAQHHPSGLCVDEPGRKPVNLWQYRTNGPEPHTLGQLPSIAQMARSLLPPKSKTQP